MLGAGPAGGSRGSEPVAGARMWLCCAAPHAVVQVAAQRAAAWCACRKVQREHGDSLGQHVVQNLFGVASAATVACRRGTGERGRGGAKAAWLLAPAANGCRLCMVHRS